MRALVLVVALGACLPPVMDYELHIVGELSTVQPYIDGQLGNRLTESYDSHEEVDSALHLVELRIGDLVVRSIHVRVEDCSTGPEGLADYREDICALDSGDLRADGPCERGRECEPECHSQSACTGRCTSRITSTNPLKSHLACAPWGPKFLGEACELIPHPDGAYDDCGDNLTCLDGRCHRTCLAIDRDCHCLRRVSGHAPELRVCDVTLPLP
jgi:hypothetical protein